MRNERGWSNLRRALTPALKAELTATDRPAYNVADAVQAGLSQAGFIADDMLEGVRDDRTRQICAKAWAVMPEDVRSELYGRGFTFIDTGGYDVRSGIVASASPTDVWINSPRLAQYSEPDATKIIAHELAHAYLRHTLSGADAAKAAQIEDDVERWLFWNSITDRQGRLIE